MADLTAQEGRRRRRERRRDQDADSGDRVERIRSTLRELADRPEFTAGVRYGLIATGIGLVVGIAWRAARRRPAPVAGVLLAGATLAGLADALDLPSDLLRAVVVLGIAVVVTEVLRLPVWAGMAAAIPGAVLMSQATGVPDRALTQALVIGGTVLGGGLAADFDRRFGDRAVATLLLAGSVMGVYVTVPETEKVVVLLGAALPLPLLAWPVPLARAGRAGCYVVTALWLWTAAVDGATRDGALVGAVGCLGLLAVEPIMRVIAGRSPLDLLPTRLPTVVWAIPVAAVHAVLVLVAARVAGLQERADEAALLLLPVIGGVLVVAVVLRQRGQPRSRPSRS